MVLSLIWYPLAAGGELAPPADGPRYEFTLQDIQGRQRSQAEFQGQVVLINFWASWCTPCVQEIPSLLRLQDSMRGYPFTIVGINVAEGERRAQTAAKRLGISFPVLLDRDGRIFNDWGGEVLPSAFVLDRQGRARFVAQGPLDWDRDDIRNALKDLMAASVETSGVHPDP